MDLHRAMTIEESQHLAVLYGHVLQGGVYDCRLQHPAENWSQVAIWMGVLQRIASRMTQMSSNDMDFNATVNMLNSRTGAGDMAAFAEEHLTEKVFETCSRGEAPVVPMVNTSRNDPILLMAAARMRIPGNVLSVSRMEDEILGIPLDVRIPLAGSGYSLVQVRTVMRGTGIRKDTTADFCLDYTGTNVANLADLLEDDRIAYQVRAGKVEFNKDYDTVSDVKTDQPATWTRSVLDVNDETLKALGSPQHVLLTSLTLKEVCEFLGDLFGLGVRHYFEHVQFSWS